MKIALRLVTLTLLAAAGTPAPAGAATSPINSEHARAVDRCEAAVAETIRRMRGRDAQEVEFVGAKRAVAPTPEEELGVKGEGRYRGPGGSMAFTYSCAFSSKTGATSGVLFRETAGTPTANAGWQPDLSRFSPDACEAATAAALKDKHPRVGAIAFDSGTRQLRPASNELTRLEGRGAMVRAPGMAAVSFSYDCEFETGSGKVVGVQTRD